MLDDEARTLFARVPMFVPHERIAAHAAALGIDAITTAGGDAGLVAGLLEWARSRGTDTRPDS